MTDADGPPAGQPVRVFLSYAHESDAHVEAVRDFWVFLRAHGVDARLDTTAAADRPDWTLWMGAQIREADHILVIASAAYRERAEGRAAADDGRGVQWEAGLIRNLLYENQARRDRVLPVVLPGQSRDGVPDFLLPATSPVYPVRELSVAGAQELLGVLLRQPSATAPPLGTPPTLRAVSGAAAILRHDVAVHVEVTDTGLRVRTELAGTPLGEQVAALPAGLASCWSALDSPSGGDLLTGLGRGLWGALFDEATGRRLVELITTSAFGTVVDVVVHLPAELAGLPVELLRLPDGRLAAATPGVRFTRRLTGVDRTATPRLAGPLKILAAVAAPEETRTKNVPLDVEAEMQALLDAVTDLDLLDGNAPGGPGRAPAQVRILEVASLAEIGAALAADQYHVLHLSAHGSADGVELEDEDGDPEAVDSADLVQALRGGGHPLPLVVLSSCSGASGGADGLAATLVRAGADRVIAMQAPVGDTFATALAHTLYRVLAADPDAAVAHALAEARRTVHDALLADGRRTGVAPRPEFAVPTLLAAGTDPPLRDPALPAAYLSRATLPPSGGGVRGLPLGELIGRRSVLRTATAVLRRSARDRARVGDWAGLALTGIGGIGKTAVAGRILTRAREQGWLVAEHVGSWSPPTLIASVADALVTSGRPQFAQLAEPLRSPEVDDGRKLALVVTLLSRAPLLVLFDDFEQNLTPDARAFTDPGFAEIFAGLCAATEVGRIVVTCRYPVPDTDDVLLRVDLPALTPAELRRLFLRLPTLRELPADDRRLVVRTIGGHPRLIEFLDVLLRDGLGARFRSVTAKLRTLARQENVDLRPQHALTDAVTDAVRLGSRDILLDALVDDLTPVQLELLLQAALARAPFTVDDLVRTQQDPDSASADRMTLVRDVERLIDQTLLSPAVDHQVVVHPWVAAALEPRQTPDDLLRRHQRGAEMRLNRLNTGRGTFDDLVEFIRHLAGAHRYDEAVNAAFEACDLVGGEVAVSALLAEAVPLIPIDHPEFLPLADRECEALLAIGLASATAQRYQRFLDIAEDRVAAHPGNASYQRDLSVSHNRLGNLARTAGDAATADYHYRTALTIRERLATTDPGNTEAQRDLSVSNERLGDLVVAVGDTATADHHYRTALTITERLTTTDPENAEYQRDLSIIRNKLGDLASEMSDTSTAEHHYRTALAIRERLTTTDPDNIDYQRGLATTHQRLGDLASTMSDTSTAEHHHRTALAIAERLTTTDPDNIQYQRDLAIGHDRLGELAVTAGDTAAAEHHYRIALAITERLTTTDPVNIQYQRDLAIGHDRLGDLVASAGDTSTAGHHYRTALAVTERLTTTDPDNAAYQRDLSVSHNRLGDLAASTGDTAAAEHHYRTALTITERLTTTDPDNTQYQRDLSVSHNRLGDLAASTGDTAAAEHHYRIDLAIAERLTTTDPDNAAYQRDLSVSHNRLGDLAHTAGDTPTAEHHYRATVAIVERLGATDPGNVQYQRDLEISRQRLASLSESAGPPEKGEQPMSAPASDS